MGNTRRNFIKSSIVGGAGLAAGGLVEAATSCDDSMTAKQKLQILILGGTGFIGPHMVREALRRDHTVTLFNRGRTNNDLFPDVELLVGDRNRGLDSLRGHSWDVVIDNSGYVPRHVEDSARLLKDAVSHYLYVSTISVYESFAVANSEDSALAKIDDESMEEVTGESYGPLKALCEQRVTGVYADDSHTILRPTYICGAGDKTDRFTYWPTRTAEGGEMLWPGMPQDKIQIIDVQDFANFTIDCLERKTAGIFNTVTPAGSYSIGDLHDDCKAISSAPSTSVWVDQDFLRQQNALEGGSIPIWSTTDGEYSKIAFVDGEKAAAAGLQNRPMRETARNTLAWWKTLPEERRARRSAGLSATREAELLAAWKARAT